MTRHLVTSALPYINGVKHLGNLVGSLLPADVHARFLRQHGHEVLFVCGTDEHGAPAELAAAEAGLGTPDYCDRLHEVQREVFRRLLLSFDHFGRTSSPTNHQLTIALYRNLQARGFIEHRTTTQLYSATDGRFLPDRYVRGTCPRCGGDARGDQCDLCSTLLDPTELLDPHSAISGARDLEARQTEHAFLRLSALQPRVEQYVVGSTDWPPLTRQIASKWLAEGLRDRCITRDLAWGVPVPDLPGKVFYCWFDAPIGYISLTREARPDEDWWDPDGDVRITQFLGKDNLPFHTVLFPASLLGSDRFRTADQIKALHWLSWYGEKFSTSQRRGVFLDQAVELLPAEVWRWGLLAQIPETADSAFTWERLATVVNKDLVGQLGNFVHRTGALAERVGDAIPEQGPWTEAEHDLLAEVTAAIDQLETAHRELHFRAVIEALRELFRIANRYVDHRAPWALIREDPDQGRTVLSVCLHLWRVLADAVDPVLPETAATLRAALRVDRGPPAPDLQSLAGRPYTRPKLLFDRIDPEELAGDPQLGRAPWRGVIGT